MVFEKPVGMTICLHFEANRNKNQKSRNQNRLQARIKSKSVIINFSFFIWSNAGSLYNSWVIQHCSFRERVPMIKMDQIIPQISIRLGKVSYLTSLIGRHTFQCNTSAAVKCVTPVFQNQPTDTLSVTIVLQNQKLMKTEFETSQLSNE